MKKSLSKNKLFIMCIIIIILLVVGFVYVSYALTNNPRQIIIERPVKSKYLIRLGVNKKIQELIENDQSKLVYEYYDQFTNNRKITICLIHAALLYGVPIHIQFAIANTESVFNPRAMCYNKNKHGVIWSVDVGLNQLNSYFYSEYSMEQLLNVELNSTLSAAHLKRELNKYGNWPRAIQAYNRGEIIDEKGLNYYNKVITFEHMLDKHFNDNFLEIEGL